MPLVVDCTSFSWSILVHNDIIKKTFLAAGVDTSRRLWSEELALTSIAWHAVQWATTDD